MSVMLQLQMQPLNPQGAPDCVRHSAEMESDSDEAPVDCSSPAN
jgi:hypothetical protein